MARFDVAIDDIRKGSEEEGFHFRLWNGEQPGGNEANWVDSVIADFSGIDSLSTANGGKTLIIRTRSDVARIAIDAEGAKGIHTNSNASGLKVNAGGGGRTLINADESDLGHAELFRGG